MVFKNLYQNRRNEKAQIAVYDNSSSDSVIEDGELQYTREQGKNGTAATTQEASGAPVEIDSPLGYHVNWYTIIFLNIGQMVGTGVFSTRRFSSPLLDVADFCSWIYPPRPGLCWIVTTLLANRSSYCCCWFCSLPCVGLLLPQSFRQRSRVPRTGVSSAEILLSYRFRHAQCSFGL